MTQPKGFQGSKSYEATVGDVHHADRFAVLMGSAEKQNVFLGDICRIEKVEDGKIFLVCPYKTFIFENKKEAHLYVIGAEYSLVSITPSIEGDNFSFKLTFQIV